MKQTKEILRLEKEIRDLKRRLSILRKENESLTREVRHLKRENKDLDDYIHKRVQYPD